MAGVKRRNSPKTPKTAKFDAEILPSPYRRGETEESFPEGLPMTDSFGLEQQPKRIHDLL